MPLSSKQDLKAQTNGAILRVAAIVGCELPANVFYSNIVCEETATMILDFFPVLNYYEVVLAVRLNAKGYKGDADIEPIKFTGGNFNVAFLTKVLENFMELRFIVDRKIQISIDGY